MSDCTVDVTITEETVDVTVPETTVAVSLDQMIVEVDPTTTIVDVEIDDTGIDVEVPESGGGDTRCAFVLFTFQSASPLAIATQQTDEILVESRVVIETAFDGAAPTAVLGFSPGDDSAIFEAGDIKLNRACAFESSASFRNTSGSAREVRLTLNPDSSSTGDGYVLLTFKRI